MTTEERRPLSTADLVRPTGRIAGLVLAAGESRRMGRPKALLPVGNEFFVQRVRRALLDAALHPVLVVLGHDALEIARTASLPPEGIVLNPDYQQGMLSSLVAGLRVLEPTDVEAAVVALVDGPDISTLLVRRLMERYWATRAPIVEPVYQGKAGHPFLIARELWPEIAAADPEQGPRAVIRRHRARAAQVIWDDSSILTDLDTPADYQAWIASRT
ncbi:MAG: hypothetical protein KatS3mg061_2786 [Dehalococcoidia bacterium]|nr:MAG: hypothetical protein KatS3mg061_2786 [Dehalococcoidia bacterium]